ncbi:MAG: hypothetical protein RBT70_06665 [Alphaproteobacteria bacterium]|jgi:hypothetical protein|nr:hypothetical protein [Alphaproteobacteria bacterium]
MGAFLFSSAEAGFKPESRFDDKTFHKAAAHVYAAAQNEKVMPKARWSPESGDINPTPSTA